MNSRSPAFLAAKDPGEVDFFPGKRGTPIPVLSIFPSSFSSFPILQEFHSSRMRRAVIARSISEAAISKCLILL
jgi:hypothetical protein